MRRGPSRTGYLNIPGTSACPENTSLHRENFVRVEKLHAGAAQHDSDGAILLGRQVDRPLDRGFLDVIPAHSVVEMNLREHPGDLLGPFGFRFDFQCAERNALLSQDRDDVGCGTCHRRQEGGCTGLGPRRDSASAPSKRISCPSSAFARKRIPSTWTRWAFMNSPAEPGRRE